LPRYKLRMPVNPKHWTIKPFYRSLLLTFNHPKYLYFFYILKTSKVNVSIKEMKCKHAAKK